MKEILFGFLVILLIFAAPVSAYYESGEGNGLAPTNEGTYEQSHPTDLHYILMLTYDNGRISQKDNAQVENGQVNMANYQSEAGSHCRQLSLDKISGKYSANVPMIMCNYSSETNLEVESENLAACAFKYAFTLDKEYYLELTNTSGKFLASAPFTFTITTKCWECEQADSESKITVERSVSDDKFDFLIIVPYYDDASTVRIYEVKDKKKNSVFSAGVSQFNGEAKKYDQQSAE